MKLENLTIPSGEHQLAALHYQPDGDPRPLAIIYTHGFTSGKYSMDNLAAYLATKGYEGLTFDLVGHKLGASSGKLVRMMQVPESLRDVLTSFRRMTDAPQIVLVGHSLGAASSLQVAAWTEEPKSELPTLAGVAALCMGDQPARAFDSTVGKAMLDLRQTYVEGAPARQLLEELAEIVHRLPALQRTPALFVAARQDVLVSPDRVQSFGQRLAAHAEFAVIESSHLDAPDKSKVTLLRWLEQLPYAEQSLHPS
jgi:pimeloyl-ACP methyl ester carboxylesterase